MRRLLLGWGSATSEVLADAKRDSPWIGAAPLILIPVPLPGPDRAVAALPALGLFAGLANADRLPFTRFSSIEVSADDIEFELLEDGRLVTFDVPLASADDC